MRPRKSAEPSESGGFTLIEIVIAISILSIVLGVTYSALNQIIRTKKLLDDGRDSRYIANSILGRMTRELQLATASVPLMPPKDDPERRASSRVSMVGEQKGLDDGKRADSITFMALEAGQYLPKGTRSGVVQITYLLAKDPNRKDELGYTLYRSEVPYSRPFKKAYENALNFDIARNVTSLEFQYYWAAENKWLATWNEDATEKLPGMVRFRIEIASPEGRIESYATVVPLRSSN